MPTQWQDRQAPNNTHLPNQQTSLNISFHPPANLFPDILLFFQRRERCLLSLILRKSHCIPTLRGCVGTERTARHTNMNNHESMHEEQYHSSREGGTSIELSLCHEEAHGMLSDLDSGMEGASTSSNSIASIPLSPTSATPTMPSQSLDSSIATSNHDPAKRSRSNQQFITKMALQATLCSLFFLLILTISFSEWSIHDVLSENSTSFGTPRLGSTRQQQQQQQQQHMAIQNNDRGEESEFANYGHLIRQLEEEEGENINNNSNDGDNNGGSVMNASSVTDGDYSSYRCDDIFTNTKDYASNNDDGDSSSNTTPKSSRCQYAQTCDGGEGLLLPFIYCHNALLSPAQWLLLLSPILLLGLALLFRLLGSTAEEYFSPSLEMFSIKLGLPPRFAGVTLLALGNGAADVSATMNAIASDPENGYKMSLGALTGAAMFITTVVAGSVILANGGVVCRGALVRDVMALGIAVVVVSLELERGVVGPGTERLFISMYVIFVLIVLVADVYHRAVMLPRIRKETELREHQRQLEAEQDATMRAGDALNASAGNNNIASSVGGGGASVGGGGGAGLGEGLVSLDRVSSSISEAGAPLNCVGLQCGDDSVGDDRTHASAPPGMVVVETKNNALDAVLTALSNYNDDERDMMDEDGNALPPMRRSDGWGVESNVEGSRSWDRPVVLHGADGILNKHAHRHPQTSSEGFENENEFNSSAYHVMEDLDLTDRLCVEEGSSGYSAHNWSGAMHDGRQELMVHFREYLKDMLEDDESGMLEKFLLICEFPMTVCRKLTVSIPCEGSYCRALVALSLALSPLWLGVYAYSNFDVNLWGWKMGVFVSITSVVGLMIMRYAPGGDGTMATMLAVPIALYGFIVAATWIDWIADKLVGLLGFLGIILRIPNYIMGLTVLAWGNSMADLSANVTMARKGLANMAITACFAGPLFNILIGLGAGFGVLRNATKTEENHVHLTPSITTGFVFCFINCGLLLVSGLAINKGVIPVGYGYAALVLYAVYIATSLLLQFLL
mmetsp:Transcript_1873/g.3866  ORF Transcript_1873/g.3866 Transcript_1873/m.3866 type:complete len:1018 (+) Transcript_1873:91-3144(+)